MYYSENIIEEVKDASDIVDVISSYVNLTPKGRTHWGLCPFHNEKTASFSVTRDNGTYYCFGCQKGGTVFTFIKDYENVTFPEALQILADRAGIKLPEYTSQGEKEKSSLRNTMLAIYKEAATYYYGLLRTQEGKKAYHYFHDRALSVDTMNRFGLGYAPIASNLYNHLKKQGYEDADLLKAGLIKVDEKNGARDYFFNRVMFPIMDVQSRVIAFGGRAMGDYLPKYLNSPETVIFDKSRNLYGLHLAKRSRKSYFLICEGYMDVIALHQAGFSNAVATLGTALTQGHATLIARYVKEAYLVYDSDEAGVRAALRAIPILRSFGVVTRVISMEPYKDPDDFIKGLGAEAFTDRINKAHNGFMFSLEILEHSYDMQSPEGQTSFMQAVAKKLLEFDEEIERNYYIEAVAKAYQVEKNDLKKLMGKVALVEGQYKPIRVIKESAKRKESKEDGIKMSQKFLMTWIIEKPDIFRQIEKFISPKDFTEPLYEQVAEMVFSQYEAGEVKPAQIINEFVEAENYSEVASLFYAKIKRLETVQEEEKALKDTLIRVKKNSIEAQTKALDSTDIEGLQRMMQAKKSLQDLQRVDIRINS